MKYLNKLKEFFKSKANKLILKSKNSNKLDFSKIKGNYCKVESIQNENFVSLPEDVFYYFYNNIVTFPDSKLHIYSITDMDHPSAVHHINERFNHCSAFVVSHTYYNDRYFIVKNNDDYYYVIYEKQHSGYRRRPDPIFWKCDQIEGLINFLYDSLEIKAVEKK